ncbi:MAG: hypothetical protein K9M80_00355 [Candidatus Marinimicrobia bacterium]|nr:hypothetical protein [Candidatus Neomarinimicrobiota bacterium]
MNNNRKSKEHTRREKEMGLQIYIFEQILDKKVKFTDAKNNELLLQFIKINGDRIRKWLDSLSDHELNMKFKQLPHEIKACIDRKDFTSMNIYGAA